MLDERLQTTPDSQLVQTAHESPVLVFSSSKARTAAITAVESQGVEVIGDGSGGRNIMQVLEELGRRSIQSVLVEGGAGVAGAFIDAGLVDKITFFIAPLIIGGRQAPGAVGGLGAEKMADALSLEDVEIVQRGADIEVTGYPVLSEPPAVAGG